MIATAAGDTVRIYAASTTRVVEEARSIHGTWPTATAAFGRVLTGTLMMGVMADNFFRLTVEVTGNGPLGKILAISNRRGTVKGEVLNPKVDLDLSPLGKLDVAGAVGAGYLAVIKDYGLKKPYQGIVPLQSGEIAQDFAYYFTKSEQTPSAVALGVLVTPGGEVEAAGGLIVQMMPGASSEIIAGLEESLKVLPPLTSQLSVGITPDQLIRDLIPASVPVKFLEQIPVQYFCDCSRERFLGPLVSLGREELETILREQGEIEVRCHFCNTFYQYHDVDFKIDN